MNINILRFDSIASTNDEAARQAKLGADEGLCVIARTQTAGRGRQGRVWISEPDSGLYFSIVLRPKVETRYMSLVTLMAGVAVHDALKELGLKPDIKWVNDVLINEKKIGGILAETIETPTGLAVIVGIGINLTSRNFPEDIADSATSIAAETGKKTTANEIAEVLTKYLTYFYNILSETSGPAEIVEYWRLRSTYFYGKPVRVTMAGEIIEGTTEGLEETGALRLRTAEGKLKTVRAGDVERLRAKEATN